MNPEKITPENGRPEEEKGYFDEATATIEQCEAHLQYLTKRYEGSKRFSPDDAKELEEEMEKIRGILEEKEKENLRHAA